MHIYMHIYSEESEESVENSKHHEVTNFTSVLCGVGRRQKDRTFFQTEIVHKLERFFLKDKHALNSI